MWWAFDWHFSRMKGEVEDRSEPVSRGGEDKPRQLNVSSATGDREAKEAAMKPFKNLLTVGILGAILLSTQPAIAQYTTDPIAAPLVSTLPAQEFLTQGVPTPTTASEFELGIPQWLVTAIPVIALLAVATEAFVILPYLIWHDPLLVWHDTNSAG